MDFQTRNRDPRFVATSLWWTVKIQRL